MTFLGGSEIGSGFGEFPGVIQGDNLRKCRRAR